MLHTLFQGSFGKSRFVQRGQSFDGVEIRSLGNSGEDALGAKKTAVQPGFKSL